MTGTKGQGVIIIIASKGQERPGGMWVGKEDILIVQGVIVVEGYRHVRGWGVGQFDENGLRTAPFWQVYARRDRNSYWDVRYADVVVCCYFVESLHFLLLGGAVKVRNRVQVLVGAYSEGRTGVAKF